jgi:hypothetical protein
VACLTRQLRIEIPYLEVATMGDPIPKMAEAGAGRRSLREVYAGKDFRVVERRSKSSCGGATLF